jgi:hypothetical protein
MSREVMAKTVGKAVTDSRFRKQLLDNPKSALSGLSLSSEEYSAITQLTNASFDFLQENADVPRLSDGASCINKNLSGEVDITLSRYNLTDFGKLLMG